MKHLILVLTLVAGCSGRQVDPRSGCPREAPGEVHAWLGGPGPSHVWAVHHPDEPDVVAVIFQNGTRASTEGCRVSWAPAYFPGVGWADLPRLPDDSYPVVLLGRADPSGRVRFVTALRARDGSHVTARPPASP